MSLFTESHSASAPSPEPGSGSATPVKQADASKSRALRRGELTLYAEDLNEGDSWTSELTEIESKDVHAFADLTGDHTPLHGEDVASPFGKPIAHGLLGLSVLAGLGTKCPKASTLALVSIEEWRFTAPIYFGDQVRCRNEIVSIESHGRRAVKVRWLRQLLNQNDRVVQHGYFTTLVGSKDRDVSKPR